MRSDDARPIALEKRIVLAFAADGGDRPVAAIDLGLVWKTEQVFADVADERVVVAVRKIRTADRTVEEGVAHDHDAGRLTIKAAASRGVTRGIKDAPGR